MRVVNHLTAKWAIVASLSLPDNGTRHRETDLGIVEMLEQWIKVAASDGIAEGSAVEVVVDGDIVAIFRDGGQLYAIDGMCAHQGGPLADGTVAAGCVTCPWHGWQYELRSGIQTINRQPLQKTYRVREINGQVEVDLGTGRPDTERGDRD